MNITWAAVCYREHWSQSSIEEQRAALAVLTACYYTVFEIEVDAYDGD